MLGVFRFAACDFAMNSCVSKHLCRGEGVAKEEKRTVILDAFGK